MLDAKRRLYNVFLLQNYRKRIRVKYIVVNLHKTILYIQPRLMGLSAEYAS